MGIRDLNRIKVVLADKKRSNCWLIDEQEIVFGNNNSQHD